MYDRLKYFIIIDKEPTKKSFHNYNQTKRTSQKEEMQIGK